ncbi:MAG: (Fe-S)-binding protein [Thermoguttaceae bacterium]|jgi:Fe-S oxidoreductase
MFYHENTLLLAALPTSEKLYGVYGAVWLMILVALASAAFGHRMYCLIRVLACGRRENRLDHPVQRAALFLKEVLAQSRMWTGESIINWAHPLIFWGFCCFVLASALMFTGGMLDPWLPAAWHIPQAEEIPVLGTIVDAFAVLVLAALAASSFRRYILAPRGLQRTWDATIVVSLIAALMVTFVLSEAGSRVRDAAAVAAGEHAEGWGQTFLPAGIVTAKALRTAGMDWQGVATLGLACWWIHLFILLFFLVYLPRSKHMHLIWAPFAVFFGELPRKKGVLGPPAAPEETAAAQDASKAAEAGLPVLSQLGTFTWRQLMNAYTCAECGRCERACPANASGARLSPRQVVHDLKEFVLGEGIAAVRGKAQGPGAKGDSPIFATMLRTVPAKTGAVPPRQLIGGMVEPEALWDCTTCYACMEVCPVRNEHVPLVVEMRRKLVERGTVDARLQDTLMSLQRYGNSLGASPRKRFDWAKDLPQPLKDAEKEPVETLWFLGDYAAFHPSSARVSRMVALLFYGMGLDFGCLLRSEKSAGNDVRRAGEEGLFEMLAEQNMKALGKAQFQRIVTTDPHTYHVLKHEYPRFGLDKPVYHYSEILDEALRQGQLRLKQKLEGTAVLHDACYLGRYNGIYDPPRRVVDALGLRRLEMPRSREHSFCCGAGGGKIWMEDDPAVKERPAVLRIREALAMEGVTHFVVACPKDLGMFEDAVKTTGQEGRLKVVDLGELVFEAS